MSNGIEFSGLIIYFSQVWYAELGYQKEKILDLSCLSHPNLLKFRIMEQP